MKRKYLSTISVLLVLFVCASAAPSIFAQDGPPESQQIGVGMRADGFVSAVDFNARIWTEMKLGFEIGFGKRHGWTEVPVSVLYTIAHIDTEPVYIRPYAGGGISYNRIPLGWGYNANECVSDWQAGRECEPPTASTKIGGQGFVGAEFTFKAFPRLSVGTDIGHWRVPSGWQGHSFSETGIKLNIHYYLK